MTRIGIVVRPRFDPERLRAVAEAADECGVDELWLWEDCFDEGGISAATAVLAWTTRLEVGIGVLPVPLRNPALAAMEIATLCRLFPRRVHAGFGHGVLDWMGQVGARVGSPMTLLAEYVSAVRALVAGETVTEQGRYVRLRDVRLGTPVAHPPQWHVGAVGPKTIALAGEVADGLLLTGGSSPDDVRAARRIFDGARDRLPGRGRVTTYLMAVSGADAAARLDAELADWERDAPAAEVGIAGDAGAIAAGIGRWADAGADAVILQPVGGEDPVAYARFVGEQVRPRLG
jgi:alkanesulfonate monooxygenase SsuD/methylene tetrahydromethanopterin reductase-like flavin-dependent oxidoreductase (luciferase family)